VHVLDPIQLLLDGLPQHWIVDDPEEQDNFEFEDDLKG